jgi:hypothetical protein
MDTNDTRRRETGAICAYCLGKHDSRSCPACCPRCKRRRAGELGHGAPCTCKPEPHPEGCGCWNCLLSARILAALDGEAP